MAVTLPINLTILTLQTQWSAILNPIIAQPIVNGNQVVVTLQIGANTFNHGLSQMQIGWIIVDQNAAGSVYRSQPFNSQTLTLTSSAVVTATIWVF